MEDDLEYERKLAALRAAIKAGDDSGIASPGSFNRVHAKFGLPPIEDEPDSIPDQREGH